MFGSGGGGGGKEGGKSFMNAFGFFCLFGWVFFVLLDRNLIFRFVFVVFLNPYFDLFSLVNNLNFPHPSPPPLRFHPRGGDTFTKTVSSVLFTATAVPPLLLSKITIWSNFLPVISRIVWTIKWAVKNNTNWYQWKGRKWSFWTRFVIYFFFLSFFKHD